MPCVFGKLHADSTWAAWLSLSPQQSCGACLDHKGAGDGEYHQ
jgi:hypothetical protein